jgi:hypothetical protein
MLLVLLVRTFWQQGKSVKRKLKNAYMLLPTELREGDLDSIKVFIRDILVDEALEFFEEDINPPSWQFRGRVVKDSKVSGFFLVECQALSNLKICCLVNDVSDEIRQRGGGILFNLNYEEFEIDGEPWHLALNVAPDTITNLPNLAIERPVFQFV